MRISLMAAIAACVLESGCVNASPNAPPSAPPARCEIRLSTWCIQEGAYEITRRLASDSVHDRFWFLRGRFKPESVLVVLEPNGCKNGLSDKVDLAEFEHQIEWQGRTWDRFKVRLKSDGSCDLTVLLPPDEGDSMEWAFTEGVPLIRPCKDTSCDDVGLVQIKPALAKLRQESR
mgnify:CR=1 FL=1